MNSSDLRNLYESYSGIYEGFVDPEEGEAPSGRSPIENVSYHKNPRVRRKAMRAMAKQMEKEYGGKWKAKSDDPVKESYDLYDLIVEYLIQEGYVDCLGSAELIVENMSEAWMESIMEAYKKLPIGKMMRKVEYRAEREADTRADMEREADDPNSTMGYSRARKAYEKADRNKELSHRMINVADTHNKKAAKAKSKYNNK